MKKEEYCEVCDRVKSKCICKKEEAKEQTMADASGSFEAPIFGDTILKKNIHKLHNFKSHSKEVKEQMDAGVSAVAMYDGPIGTGRSSPMDKTKKHRKDPLALDEKGRTASITAASTDDMIATKKGFPRFGGPEAKFVEIDSKCKTFPYCNQGDSGKKFKFINEIHGMKEAIESVAKKYNLSIEQVSEMVMKESGQISERYELPIGIDMGPVQTWGSRDKETAKFLYHLITIDPGTKKPAPLDFKTKNEGEFAKLKLLLQGNDIKFHEEKHPIGDEQIHDIPKNEPPEDDEADYAGDIFNNTK